MKITKFGHCCLLIETRGKKILTDPGSFTTDQNNVKGIDIVLITHEHADHFHVESVKKIKENNPNAIIITNSAVGKLLDKENISHSVLEGKTMDDFGEISIQAYDHRHEEIFEEFGQVQNTGYFIADELFYPGDSYTEPGRPVPILALPVAGPWCKISDALRYALHVKPKKAFPVHDAVVATEAVVFYHMVPETVLTQSGIEFVSMKAGDTIDF